MVNIKRFKFAQWANNFTGFFCHFFGQWANNFTGFFCHLFEVFRKI